MHIVLEPGSYSLLNIGDVAMLQVAVSRIRAAFPDALLHIVTSSPSRLAVLDPAAVPLPVASRRAWYQQTVLPQRIRGFVGGQKTKRFEEKMRRSQPEMWNSMLKVKSSLRQRECQSCEYYDAIRGADLFVVSGQGTLNDLMQRNSANLLEFLEMGRRWRIPTVMLSQGIGPITVPALLDRMKCVLPSVEFITLREKRLGLPLLQSLGVDDSRIAITGDDAVELAYTRRQEKFGCGLGVNLRLANYTGIDLSQLPLIRSVLQRVARRLSAPLIPIPIAHDPSNHDPSAIRELLKGLDTTPDGGESLVSVATTIGQVGRCRVVVTGSYHAGVFAMSQGIPVVGIAATSYYQGKFQGLQDQFGGGCEVLAIKDVAECLEETVERLWMSAEQIRTGLLAAAKQQIEEGLFAYRRALSSIRVQYYNG